MLYIRKMLVGFVVFFISQQVLAATATGSLPVTATVLSNCTLGSITSVAFGNYDPTSATPNNAMGTIPVNCTNEIPYNIGLNAGTGAGATVGSRLMTRTPTPGTLQYSLYQDGAHTINWGNTVGTDTLAGTGTGSLVASTVYGQIPASQSATAGSYSDTVTVTVTF